MCLSYLINFDAIDTYINMLHYDFINYTNCEHRILWKWTKVHLKFLKFILNLKSSTPNCMVYGETGRYPLLITVKTRMIMYWAKILMGNDNKLTSVFYRFFYKCYSEG